MKIYRGYYCIIFALVIFLGACSEKQAKEEDNNADIAPAAEDAGTDAVPQPSAENPGGANELAAVNPSSSPSPSTSSTPNPLSSTPPAPMPLSTSAPELTPSPMTAPTPAPTETMSAQNSNPPSTADASMSAASSASDTGSGQTEDYTVQNGDTLMRIAFETYGDVMKWRKIYKDNKDKISSPNKIPTGVVLKIEKPNNPVSGEHNGEKYLIKTGDTLGKISNTLYGTPSKWKDLWENNKQLIHNPNRIFAGFYLYYVAHPGDGDSNVQQNTLSGTTTPDHPQSNTSHQMTGNAPANNPASSNPANNPASTGMAQPNNNTTSMSAPPVIPGPGTLQANPGDAGSTAGSDGNSANGAVPAPPGSQ